jgi:NodT family efflux transporter outer membrane factor (OMF) lipoprotein
MQSLRATRIPRAALLLPLLLASACASVPNLGPKPVPSAESDYASTASLSGPQSAWPADGWWRRYGDAQLDQLMSEGLTGSPDLAAASARFRRAQGLAQAAGAALLPQVNASASATEQNPSQNNGIPVSNGWLSSGSVAGGISLDLDLWGKNRAALRAAKKDAEAAEFDSDEAKLALTTGIASAYADLAELYAQRDNLESALDIRTQTLKLVQQRVAAGLDSDAELRQAQARIPQTKADLAATDEAITNEKHALAELVGAGPDRALSIARPAIASLQAQGIPADASIDLIGRRPDIAAARARVEAAGERIT